MQTNEDSKQFQIYIITDLDDDSYYIGSAWGSSTAETRFDLHLRLKGGARLLNEKVLLGHSFKQELIDKGFGPWEEALLCEEAWIADYMINDSRECLNLNAWPTAGPRSIKPLSAESRARIGAAVSIALTGRPRPDLADMYRGKPRPGGTPWLIGRSPVNKGKKSPEISAAKLGKPRSPQMRERMKVWCSQRWTCDECGMVSNAPAIGTHQKSSGHIGKHLTVPEEIPALPTIKTRHKLYLCGDCDRITTGAGMAQHHKFSDHTGRTFVEVATELTNNRNQKHDSEYIYLNV